LLGLFPLLQWIWADGGYSGKLEQWAWKQGQWILAMVKRNTDVKGWQLLPRRWIVERTFGWLGRYRRLSKDYEGETAISESMIRVALIHTTVRRVARTPGRQPESQRERIRRKAREAAAQAREAGKHVLRAPVALENTA
jgi:hypothetical protein